jgi:hypothetical protein
MAESATRPPRRGRSSGQRRYVGGIRNGPAAEYVLIRMSALP